MKAFLFLLLFFYSYQPPAFSQDATINYIESVVEDSVQLFINKYFYLTDKTCADYVRFIRADSKGDFYGFFEDRTVAGALVARGHYAGGVKHGFFELYHESGKLWCKGNYKDNQPDGTWEFFYPDGKPERKLNIRDGAVLMVDFFDENGTQLVSNGNGNFKGFVAGTADYQYPPSVIAEGTVVLGVQDGTWKSVFFDQLPYCNEEYKKGKFVKGNFPQAMAGGSKTYRDHSFLDAFFLTNYFNKLETLKLNNCPVEDPPGMTVLPPITVQFTFDMQRFISDLRSDVNRAIEYDITTGNTREYREGDSELSIQFSVKPDGRPDDFSVRAGMGRSVADAIQNALRKQVFPVNAGKITFYMKLHFIPGGQYRYTVGFTN